MGQKRGCIGGRRIETNGAERRMYMGKKDRYKWDRKEDVQG